MLPSIATRARALLGATLLAILAGGCTLVAPVKKEPPGSTATLLGEVDAQGWCSMVGVFEIVLQTRLVACPAGDVGCAAQGSPQPVEGTVVTCPSTTANVLASVEVPGAGTYRVEAVARFTAGGSDTECYATDSGSVDVMVEAADVEDGVDIMLEPTGHPCPPA